MDDILGWRSPNFVFRVPKTKTGLLLKNYSLSDDIAFRFSRQDWPEWPLTADKFARWIHQTSASSQVINLFMDYETFGEHHWASSGIFDFLAHLPREILREREWDFATPSEVLKRYESVDDLHFHRVTSWADLDRDVSAWQGNRIQRTALSELLMLKPLVHELDDPAVFDVWRKLQTSDHFYYMSTKGHSDGAVHSYFSPYESPYDAFIHYMNVLKNFRDSLAQLVEERRRDRIIVEGALSSIRPAFPRQTLLEPSRNHPLH